MVMVMMCHSTYLKFEYTNKEEMHTRMSEEKGFWDQRPLAQDVAEYACTDVLLLHRLVAVLKNRMNSAEQEEWKLYSTAYTTLVRSVDDPNDVVFHDGVPMYGIADFDKVCEIGTLKHHRACDVSHQTLAGTGCGCVRETTGTKGSLEEEQTRGWLREMWKGQASTTAFFPLFHLKCFVFVFHHNKIQNT